MVAFWKKGKSKDYEVLGIIDEAQRKWTRDINLSAMGLTRLPPEIGKLTEVTTLDVYNNQITQLPPEIGKLTNLKVLYMGGNWLTQLPSEIGNLKNLTVLRLSPNHLSQLPPEIGKLTNLTTLDVSNNQFKQLPHEIGNLTKLEKIYMDYAVAATIPELKKHKDGHYPGQVVVAYYKNEFRTPLIAWLVSFEAIEEDEILEKDTFEVIEKVHTIYDSLKGDRTLDSMVEIIQTDITELEQILNKYDEITVENDDMDNLEKDVNRLKANIEVKQMELQQKERFEKLRESGMTNIEDRLHLWILQTQESGIVDDGSEVITYANNVAEDYKEQIKHMSSDPLSLKLKYKNKHTNIDKWKGPRHRLPFHFEYEWFMT